MSSLIHHFITCYIYLQVKVYRELIQVRALDEDTRVSPSPLDYGHIIILKCKNIWANNVVNYVIHERVRRVR